MDDGTNGELVRQYLREQTRNLAFSDDQVRLQLATFYNSNGNVTSGQLNIISTLAANNTFDDITGAIDEISLDTSNKYKTSIGGVLMDALTTKLEKSREGVDVVVLILSDGNIHTDKYNDIDKLFNDPYWLMNWVAL